MHASGSLLLKNRQTTWTPRLPHSFRCVVTNRKPASSMPCPCVHICVFSRYSLLRHFSTAGLVILRSSSSQISKHRHLCGPLPVLGFGKLMTFRSGKLPTFAMMRLAKGWSFSCPGPARQNYSSSTGRLSLSLYVYTDNIYIHRQYIICINIYI